MAIFQMREKQPAYNLINNNCQNFALNLLDKIRIGKHREFATTYAVYQRAIGAGAIKDLFADQQHLDQQADQADQADQVDQEQKPELQHHDTLQMAHQVMDENTTKLDNHHSFFR